MLKFLETKGIPAGDDISSSTSVFTMAVTTSYGNERDSRRSLEGAFGEYMVSPFAAMLKKNMGMMRSNQLFRKSPPHFSLSFLKPDIGAAGSTMTVVYHCAVPQFEFIRICFSASLLYSSQTMTTVFYSALQVNLA